MEFDFKWFDFAAMAILGLSGVMGFARGLIREVFTVIAFIAGILAALFLISCRRRPCLRGAVGATQRSARRRPVPRP